MTEQSHSALVPLLAFNPPSMEIKMSFRKNILAAAALLVSAVGVSLPTALAQDVNIAVLDRDRLVVESVAGQDMQIKLQTIGEAMNAELNPVAAAIESEGRSIEIRTAGKSIEDIQADPVLAAEVGAYMQRAQSFSNAQQIKANEMSLTERQALAQFYVVLRPVLSAVVEETGVDIILDRSTIIFGSPAVDITDAVLAKMDETVTSIEVVRQSMPQQGAVQ